MYPGNKTLPAITDVLLNNLPCGLVVINHESIIQFSNEYFASVFDKPVDQVLNIDFYSLFSFDSQNDIRSYLQKSFSSQENIESYEVKIITAEKKTIWIRCNQKVILQNEHNYLFLFIENITDQKKLFLDLQDKRNHFQTIFNSINDIVLICNVNYGKTLSNFLDANDETFNKLNFSRIEILMRHPLDILFRNEEEFLVDVLERLIERGSYVFTSSIMSKNKLEFPVEINSHLFEYQNRPAVIFIARDLTERYRYESTLMKYGDKLRNLALHIQSIREEERTIISREIHDELGQVLTVLKIQVSLLVNKLTPSQSELKQKFDSIIEMIDKSVESVQKICEKLRPGILDDLGIIAAIEWQTNEFSKRTGIDCNTDLPGEEINLDADKKTAVFRIFQEALTNIARHANASKVSTILYCDDNFLHLQIKDNGKGITKNQIQNPKSLGILGMRERTEILGGKFNIKSTMGSGTLVSLILPLDK